MPEDLVSEALRRALAVRQPAAGLVIHSDQGSSFRNLAKTRLKISYRVAYYSAERRYLALDRLAPTTSKPIFKLGPNSVRLS
jgi:putative transposase